MTHQIMTTLWFLFALSIFIFDKKSDSNWFYTALICSQIWAATA